MWLVLVSMAKAATTSCPISTCSSVLQGSAAPDACSSVVQSFEADYDAALGVCAVLKAGLMGTIPDLQTAMTQILNACGRGTTATTSCPISTCSSVLQGLAAPDACSSVVQSFEADYDAALGVCAVLKAGLMGTIPDLQTAMTQILNACGRGTTGGYLCS
ncbi:14 kDa proline-rich protein DC2.15-like [Senna tora]|uniref:14 kDa proline-rich protein DC2.15-like n=1 Tax=Senna tora TaxID=362788 RepID=A0A835CHV6_9FABA|nr:14 kDa proline-rich protein DC2.15-like [Senna tora]